MFYIVGGANIDIYCKSDKELLLKDSNPGRIKFSFGGVARNVVENLSNLKERIAFISAFGNDYFSKGIIDDLEKRDIDLSYSLFSNNHSSSTYVAILNENDLLVGMNDMLIMNELKKDNIDAFKEKVKDDDYLFVDTNLDKELINYILDNVKGIKVCDAISANKVIKLDGILYKLDVLKMNLLEAKTLSARPLFLESETIDYIKDLLNEGIKEVIITGNDYLYIGSKKGVYKLKHNAYKEKPVNVSGAGDALIAYYLSSRNKGLDVLEASKNGMVASILTVDDENAVRDMNMDLINKTKDEIIIDVEKY